MTQKQHLLSIVRDHPGKTASEIAELLYGKPRRRAGRHGNFEMTVSAVASALYKLSVTEGVLCRRAEPDQRAMPKIEADPVQYALYKLTGEFKGHTANRYYLASTAPDTLPLFNTQTLNS